MANAKEKKTSEPILNIEEYYSVLLLAQKVRNENFDSIQIATSPKAKIELQEKLFAKYQIPTSTPKEIEQAHILVGNIFIPNNIQFKKDYKNIYDKNTRVISEALGIPAPWTFRKIAEVGHYEKYLNELEKNGKLKVLLDVSKAPVESSKTTEIPKNEERKNNPLDDSLQKHLSRLLDSNEQLTTENHSLQRLTKELEVLIKRLREENQNLHHQLENIKMSPRTMAEETLVEQMLRQQIKTLEFENSELKESFEKEKKQKDQYRDRAVVAEAQLDLLRSGMQGIAKDVDAIDLSFIDSKKSIH